jgi:dihydrofolate reductase
MGGTLVMGSNTWRSIGRALPGRRTIVLSQAEIPELPESVILCHSARQALERAERFDGDVFIIGGAKVFEAFRDDIGRWIVTRIPTTIADADVFMPQDFLEGFSLTGEKDIGDGLKVEFFRRDAT